ncbi:MAG: ABC transporter ATP-binding protein [Lactobacillaceae bacterium]|jgi:ABC-2 type transport system ATP-binding protein|nr:ABC transporter ATP-binding protein [Lactobacillaceae bacterium]
MIKVENLVFDYMTKRAIKGISFKIEKGSIVALIGPNGAGKTTLMRCMAGLVKPFSGEIYLNDINVPEDSRHAHKYISYLSDVFGLYDNLTARQCLRYAALAFDIKAAEIDSAIAETAEMLNLTEHLDDYAGNLSRGLRQRLAIALGIIHKPQFIILDEPASGLDPEARLELSKLFTDLKNRGHTLLISSHILAELEDYATHVIVLDDGHLIKNEKLLRDTTLLKEERLIPLEIRVRANPEKTVEFLKKQEKVKAAVFENNIISCTLRGNAEGLHNLLKSLINANHEVVEFMVEKSSLKNAYFETVKKEKKDA